MKLQYSVRHLLAIALLACVTAAIWASHLRRERSIENAMALLSQVPQNGALHSYKDPASTARAANYLLSLDRRVANDAIRRFASKFPRRNNLGTLTNLLVPDAAVTLDSDIRIKNNLVFTVDFGPHSEFSLGPENIQIFETNIENAQFRSDVILLPADPLPTLNEVLVGAHEYDKLVATRMFLRSAGVDYTSVATNCKTADDLLQKLSTLSIRLDPETSQYALH